jgi:acyl carrier protein
VNTIEEEVKAIVARITKTQIEMLTLDTDLRADLNVDSLQGLQIVAAIEKRLGVVVPDEEIDMYSSVRSIVETIERVHPPGGPGR